MAKAAPAVSDAIYSPMTLEADGPEPFALSAEIEGAFASLGVDDESIATSDEAEPSAQPAGRTEGTGTPETASEAATTASEPEKEQPETPEEKHYTKTQYERSRREANSQRDRAINEAAQIRQELDQLRKQLEQMDFDREVYRRTADRLKQRADSPDGVSYRDVDNETRAAFEEVAGLQQQRAAQTQQAQAQELQRAQWMQQQMMQRNLDAASNYNRVIAELAQEAIKGQVTNLDVVALFAKQADDPDIASDIEEWRDPDITPARAQSLISRIHRRSADAVQRRIEHEKKLLEEARTKAASDPDVQPDRRTINGDASGGVSPVPPFPAVWSVSAALEDAFSSPGSAR